MSNKFSLAGILQIRRAQKDAAEQRLSRAAVSARQAERREHAERIALGESEETEQASTQTLAALAAARAASMARIADMTVVTALARDEEQEARGEFVTANRAARGVEKLETAHMRREQRAELAREQAVLDEVAMTMRRVTAGRE